MDKMIGHDVQKIMGEGEKKAPVKKISLKVKFDTKEKKEEMAHKMVEHCAKCDGKHKTKDHK